MENPASWTTDFIWGIGAVCPLSFNFNFTSMEKTRVFKIKHSSFSAEYEQAVTSDLFPSYEMALKRLEAMKLSYKSSIVEYGIGFFALRNKANSFECFFIAEDWE